MAGHASVLLSILLFIVIQTSSGKDAATVRSGPLDRSVVDSIFQKLAKFQCTSLKHFMILNKWASLYSRSGTKLRPHQPDKSRIWGISQDMLNLIETDDVIDVTTFYGIQLLNPHHITLSHLEIPLVEGAAALSFLVRTNVSTSLSDFMNFYDGYIDAGGEPSMQDHSVECPDGDLDVVLAINDPEHDFTSAAYTTSIQAFVHNLTSMLATNPSIRLMTLKFQSPISIQQSYQHAMTGVRKRRSHIAHALRWAADEVSINSNPERRLSSIIVTAGDSLNIADAERECNRLKYMPYGQVGVVRTIAVDNSVNPSHLARLSSYPTCLYSNQLDNPTQLSHLVYPIYESIVSEPKILIKMDHAKMSADQGRKLFIVPVDSKFSAVQLAAPEGDLVIYFGFNDSQAPSPLQHDIKIEITSEKSTLLKFNHKLTGNSVYFRVESVQPGRTLQGGTPDQISFDASKCDGNNGPIFYVSNIDRCKYDKIGASCSRICDDAPGSKFFLKCEQDPLPRQDVYVRPEVVEGRHGLQVIADENEDTVCNVILRNNCVKVTRRGKPTIPSISNASDGNQYSTEMTSTKHYGSIRKDHPEKPRYPDATDSEYPPHSISTEYRLSTEPFQVTDGIGSTYKYTEFRPRKAKKGKKQRRPKGRLPGDSSPSVQSKGPKLITESWQRQPTDSEAPEWSRFTDSPLGETRPQDNSAMDAYRFPEKPYRYYLPYFDVTTTTSEIASTTTAERQIGSRPSNLDRSHRRKNELTRRRKKPSVVKATELPTGTTSNTVIPLPQTMSTDHRQQLNEITTVVHPQVTDRMTPSSTIRKTGGERKPGRRRGKPRRPAPSRDRSRMLDTTTTQTTTIEYHTLPITTTPATTTEEPTSSPETPFTDAPTMPRHPSVPPSSSSGWQWTEDRTPDPTEYYIDLESEDIRQITFGHEPSDTSDIYSILTKEPELIYRPPPQPDRPGHDIHRHGSRPPTDLFDYSVRSDGSLTTEPHCPLGQWNFPACDKPCHCLDDPCNPFTGKCPDKCMVGWRSGDDASNRCDVAKCKRNVVDNTFQPDYVHCDVFYCCIGKNNTREARRFAIDAEKYTCPTGMIYSNMGSCKPDTNTGNEACPKQQMVPATRMEDFRCPATLKNLPRSHLNARLQTIMFHGRPKLPNDTMISWLESQGYRVAVHDPLHCDVYHECRYDPDTLLLKNSVVRLCPSLHLYNSRWMTCVSKDQLHAYPSTHPIMGRACDRILLS